MHPYQVPNTISSVKPLVSKVLTNVILAFYLRQKCVIKNTNNIGKTNSDDKHKQLFKIKNMQI